MQIEGVEAALYAHVLKRGSFPVLVRPRIDGIDMRGVLIATVQDGVPVVFISGTHPEARVTLLAAAVRWARVARVMLVVPKTVAKFPTVRRVVECTGAGVVVVACAGGEVTSTRETVGGRPPAFPEWILPKLEGSAALHCRPGEKMAVAFSRVFISAMEESPGSSILSIYRALPVQPYAAQHAALKRAKRDFPCEYARVMAQRALFRM